ncbi:MAG: TIGR01777 family oxidoreductase [Nitrososphaeraceae archaeon]|nr:TIGR01777 family oxidoreductase [Nitrososphaeraceae archaeon]MBV9667326.1 TIGR01777 family oxidoreductase [Nitrososphaeraceae archaeon]
MKSFIRTTKIDKISSNEVFLWHIREGAFERLNPPWHQFKVIERKGSIQNGGTVKIKMKIVGPIHTTWLVKHSDYIEGKQFRDRQIKGFFSSWTHTHLFNSFENSSSILDDHVEYSLPGGILSEIIASPLINKKLNQMFYYRHRITSGDLRVHSTANKIRGNDRPLTIGITGSSGFIGSSLIPFLTTAGHRVIRFIRHPVSDGIDNFNSKNIKSIQWNPSSESLNDSHKIDNENIDAVVNLAGENIFGRWTKEKKKRIFNSRVNTTKSLCKLLSSLDKPPKVLVSASATGYYGDRGDEILTEESPPPSSPNDFLSNVCKNWEGATQISKDSGIRVVNLRLGIVLSSSGGMLAKILPIFKLGFGGRIGNGNQYMSWIGLDDLLGLILYAISDKSITGPVNAVSPNPTTNTAFTRTLGHVLSRPTIFSTPKIIIKLPLGDELANAAILSSTHVIPERLIRMGYKFRLPYLESVLRHSLGKSIS